MLDCSETLRPECLHVVWCRIEPECSELCKTRNNGIQWSNRDRQRCGRPSTNDPCHFGECWSTTEVGISGGFEEVAGFCEWGDECHLRSGTRHMNTGKSAVLPGQTVMGTLHSTVSTLIFCYPSSCSAHPRSCSPFSSSPSWYLRSPLPRKDVIRNCVHGDD